MARYKVIKVGKPFSLDSLRQQTRKTRALNPRDAELADLIRTVASSTGDDVWPLAIGNEKPATLRAAANRMVRKENVEVYVAAHPGYPGYLLFSRQRLSRRGRRRSFDVER